MKAFEKLKIRFDKIKEKIEQLKQTLSVYKSTLSNKIVVPADDKIKHYLVVKYLILPISCFGAFAPTYGLIGIGTVLFMCFLWEIPSLLKRRFSMVSIRESVADLSMAFSASFVSIFFLIYIKTLLG